VFNTLLLIVGILDGLLWDGPIRLFSWGAWILVVWCEEVFCRFDVVFLELSLEINSLSLENI
jgi:hypothetical protein